MSIRDAIQESLDNSYEDYTLKTNEELKEYIEEHGMMKVLFHTADIERLLRENELLGDPNK